MQGIGQSIFNFPGLFLPVSRIGKPSWTVGHISPCPDLCNARRKRVNFAIDPVGDADLFGEKILIDAAVPREV